MDNKEILLEQQPTFLEVANNGKSYICPFCNNGAGKTGDGLAPYRDPATNKIKYKCFGKCAGSEANSSYDLIDLYQRKKNIASYPEALEKALAYYGLNNGVTTSLGQIIYTNPTNKPEGPFLSNTELYREALANNDFTYLQARGISPEVQRLFEVGYIRSWKHNSSTSNYTKEVIIFPYDAYNYETRAINPEEKVRYQKEGGATIYKPEALAQEGPVFVTEGVIDALSLYEVGVKAIALGSVANKAELIKYLSKHMTKAPLVLMLDNDEAGKDATAYLERNLAELGKAYIKASLPDGVKDPNEYLIKNREELKAYCFSLQAEAKEAKPVELEGKYNSLSVLDFFRNLGEQEEGLEVKTGYNCFDDLKQNLYGGLHEGLYIIGAISSLGKTSFCLQLADQIAERGTDVLFFSLEMSKTELVAKSLSRFSYEVAKEKQPATNIINTATVTQELLNKRNYAKYHVTKKDYINQAIKKYEERVKNLYIYEGRYNGQRLTITAITDIVKEHYTTTGRKPVVFIDYLQILAPADPKATDKQNTDTAVFELKELSRNLGIPVIAISSFNRDNYTEPVSMISFKESGAIEYSSDILIGLQYEGMDYTDKDTSKEKRKARINNLFKDNSQKKGRRQPVEIELKCLKNRNGRTFEASFDFIHAYNHLEEKPEKKGPELYRG